MLTKPENTLKLSIFTIGFTTLVAQIIFLRDFISVYNGNELIVGIILANWMFTTAIGAYLGKFIKKTNIVSAGGEKRYEYTAARPFIL